MSKTSIAMCRSGCCSQSGRQRSRSPCRHALSYGPIRRSCLRRPTKNWSLEFLATTSNVTGRTLRFSFARSVELARTLVPGLKQIVLVGDPFEKQPFRLHFKEEIPRGAADLTLIDLTGLPLAEVKKRVAALPDDAVILYTAMTNDGAGTTLIPSEVSQALADVANRPIVIDVDNRIGRGGTGGLVVIPALLGEEAARLVLQIFNGESAAKIPITISDAMRPVFDWRQLKRWGLDEAQLPPESEIRFRQPTIWEQYRTQIMVAILTIVFQAALIGGLLYEDRRRRTAEARSLALSTELAHVNPRSDRGRTGRFHRSRNQAAAGCDRSERKCGTELAEKSNARPRQSTKRAGEHRRKWPSRR